MFVGQEITGGSWSWMVTVKVQAAWFPAASVAILVTVVTPTGKVLPLGGTLTRLVTLQLSVAVTRKVTLLRLHCPGSAVRTRSEGQVITGGCVSLSDVEEAPTVKVHTLWLPLASV